jgi:hypothetical protein
MTSPSSSTRCPHCGEILWVVSPSRTEPRCVRPWLLCEPMRARGHTLPDDYQFERRTR